MAVVLGYGYDSMQPGSMQSFFRPVSTDIDNPQDHPRAALQSHGLDGAVDQTGSVSPDRVLSNDIRGSTHQVDNRQRPDAPACPQWDGCDDNVPQQDDGIDIDPNSTRRKRRKLTPVKTQSTLRGQNTIAFADNAGKGSASFRAIAPKQSTSDTGNAVLAINVAPEADSVQDARSHTPKKRAPRKRQQKFQGKPTDSAGSTNLEDEDLGTNSAPSKSARSTPKKKTLSLHTNGKLLSSPQDRPAASKSIDGEAVVPRPDNKLTAARTFKMRNGKFVQTLEVALKYGEDEDRRRELASRIDTILLRPSVQSEHQIESSKSHPFFTSMRKSKALTGNGESAHEDRNGTTGDAASQLTEPVAWKDIKFTARKPPAVFRSSESFRPIWPPLAFQHVGMDALPQAVTAIPDQTLSKAKHKARLQHLREDENVLLTYYAALKTTVPEADTIIAPRKRHLTGTEVAEKLAVDTSLNNPHEAILSARSRLISGSTAFDRGECAGPNIWPLQYAPSRWSEVLQPSASTLHTWLRSLAIHNVQSGADAVNKRQKHKSQAGKKRRKPRHELDDFIVGSDDDEHDGGKTTKTALLITGPHGCGKTASVFAVAKELGFEVFEIHPGMRRNAKDILDKVGDMAHNHLVQKGPGHSRSPSVAPSDTGHIIDTEVETNQTSVASFFGTKPSSKPKVREEPALRQTKREQKQSLILFEEVDLLFDDDKTFWSGVLNLINHSKRPVVLTCNDPSSIPMDDLNLYDVLDYTAIDTDLAVDYLMQIAASEGHILERPALVTLYESKGKDLRASITELNFWCQMTVGSRQGGLDWMGQILAPGSSTKQIDPKLRTFSQHTFHESLNLRPQKTADGVAAIKFDQETLGISTTEWCDFADSPDSKVLEGCRSSVEVLEQLSLITEARSACDMFEIEAASSLADMVTSICGTQLLVSDCSELSQRYLRQLRDRPTSRIDLVRVLEPIMVEKPSFPPSQGRLAPSIDTPTSSLATDVTPYVRFITCFDARTEQHRDEVFGSQGKTRTTRAARAAAEGGNKAVTRTERWFPRGLDFDRVLQTAGTWPQWYDETSGTDAYGDVTDVERSVSSSPMNGKQ